MGLNLNKGAILGVFSGLIVFIVALVFILLVNSDFDQQLINQVNSGIPSEELIPQIDKETQKMNKNAEKRLASKTVQKNLVSQMDAQSYVQDYKDEMKIISQYENARKKFAKREITKEQFLNDIRNPKEFMEQIY
jgi:hypothetical protein